MTEQGLKQSDLAGIASQETISDILCGRRGISKALATKLAVSVVSRFDVPMFTYGDGWR